MCGFLPNMWRDFFWLLWKQKEIEHYFPVFPQTIEEATKSLNFFKCAFQRIGKSLRFSACWYLTNSPNNSSKQFRQAEWKTQWNFPNGFIWVTLNMWIPRIDSYSISYLLFEKICLSVIKKRLLKPETCHRFHSAMTYFS